MRTEKEIKEALGQAKDDLKRCDNGDHAMGIDLLYKGKIAAYNYALGNDEDWDGD